MPDVGVAYHDELGATAPRRDGVLRELEELEHRVVVDRIVGQAPVGRLGAHERRKFAEGLSHAAMLALDSLRHNDR